MLARMTNWADAYIGIAGSSEYDSALHRERFIAVKQQLPWLYGMLLVSLVGMLLALGGNPDVPRAPAGILFGIILTRAALLSRSSTADLSNDAIKREIRKTFFTAKLFFVVSACWQLAVCSALGAGADADIAIFAALTALGASSALSIFPAAARVPLLVCAIPFALILTASPEPRHRVIGLTIVIVAVVRLRLIKSQNLAFERLVRSNFSVKSEKKRAVRAEHEAISQRAHVELVANTDPLTGLINRRGLFSMMGSLSVADRQQLALILLDLDGFKPINDTFGHPTGDALLRQVSRRLQQLDAEQLVVARLGGDEFAVLCRCESGAQAEAIAREAVAILGVPFVIGQKQMRISACAGISCQEDDSFMNALRRADIALYDAKRRTRGGVSLFTIDMENAVQRRTTIEQALREPALAADIQLLFQPIFDLRTMQLSSFEALARWHHPDLGWISPSEFIPITEQISILHHISDALLLRAAAAARDWPNGVRLSFNLSPVQLRASTAAANVLDIIAREKLNPNRLQIEVTETALLADFDAARANLSELRTSGVRIVLDDFGAGYSSIGYLREMRFDAIKLDGSLVTSVSQGESDIQLLRGVLELCRATGHDCVAEHVETARQLHILRQLGCEYGQGFGLCAPVTSGEAAAMASIPMIKMDRSDKLPEEVRIAVG